MPKICECCNGTGLAPAEPDPVTELRDWCRDHGHPVLPGDLVVTAVAAAILGVQPATLRQDRCYYARVPCRRSGGRVVYSLADLAKRLFASMQVSD